MGEFTLSKQIVVTLVAVLVAAGCGSAPSPSDGADTSVDIPSTYEDASLPGAEVGRDGVDAASSSLADGSAPRDTAADGSAPRDAAADGSAPRDAAADASAPRDAAADASHPRDAALDASHPRDAAVDASTPPDAASDGSLPRDAGPPQPDYIWAVGDFGVMLRWDGSQWSSVGTGLGTEIQFMGIWGSGPNDVWTIGNGTITDGFVLHWNGSKWSRVFNA